MKVLQLIAVSILFISASSFGRGDEQTELKKIDWQPIKKVEISENNTISYLYFEGAIYDAPATHLPYYNENIPLQPGVTSLSAKIVNARYQKLSPEEAKAVSKEKISQNIEVTSKISYFRKEPYALISFIPLRKNSNGVIEKLVEFELLTTTESHAQLFREDGINLRDFSPNSVLATGNWYKIGVTRDGIFKLSYSFLASLGMNMSSINPKDLRIYGNGGGMLPVKNSEYRPDDLLENAIFVNGENDGVFNSGDYILFYGQGPHRWYFSGSDDRFHHKTNIYSDTTYYFITADLGPGKRIEQISESSLPATKNVTSFDDYAFHEKEDNNLIHSGRQWFGEYFDNLKTSQYITSFNFPNLETSEEVYMKSSAVASSTSQSSFSVIVNSSPRATIYCSAVDNVYWKDQAKAGINATTFNTTGSNLSISIQYNVGNSSAKGYLDYIELNVRRSLKLAGSQLQFRDQRSVDSAAISQFTVSGTDQNTQVWDVTVPNQVRKIKGTLSGSQLSFKVPTDSLREFIAFNGTSFYTPTAFGKIANQNLHGFPQLDMVILSHPNFLGAANSLADFHRKNDGLTVEVVTPVMVYNEFSSGAQDIVAIRDFMKMFYERSTSDDDMIKYLLLVGDASFDFKNRISGNTNFIPSYQSFNSFSPTDSYISDDFFGLLDDDETESVDDLVDIAIGRLPVKTTAEAANAVNKIFHYYESSTHGDWRNIVTFIADDEDSNLHLDDADEIATSVDTNYKNYNIDKIYFDSYVQQSASGGERYPLVRESITRRVENGALIINYTGHGGELGWAHERVLEISDINNWSNYDNLPLFVTATCEFSRFDDPARVSAGELVFLNPRGGGIGLMTTTRLVYAAPNKTITKYFYNNAFIEKNGKNLRLGDIFMRTKRSSTIANPGTNNHRNFTLLGDPALMLAYPKHEVVTTSINGNAVNATPDTVKALSKVTVKGYIKDKNGSKMTSFNGLLYPTVFDKPAIIKTLANDGGSARQFSLRKNILYKGKVSVSKGEFEFSFTVPKDISYSEGYGKISYYADNGDIDAHGYYDKIVISGTSQELGDDNTGPEIELYMNDENFVFGGLTDENPTLLAFVRDSNGINTVGNGIGHDIVAILDENTEQSIVLNEYYESDLDSYQSGTVKYPFSKLDQGRHTLRLKVWDVFNNSAEAYTEFIVAESADLALDHVLNYPNPFTTNTAFYFEHNRPGVPLDVQINVFTISGQLVKSINRQITTDGYRVGPIQWNGLDDFGDKIGKGVYMYQVKARSQLDGSTTDVFERLVILK